MAGAGFVDLGVLLFVSGAVCGEIWVASRSAKCYNFSIQNAVLQFHGRIGFGSWSNHDASTVFGKFLSDFGMQLFVAGTVFGEVGA